MRPQTPPSVSPVTVERRTVIRWLGGAAVLALGGDALSACLVNGQTRGRSPDSGPTDGGSEAVGATGLTFQPGSGDGALYDGWYENTVDEQNLSGILSTWKLSVDGMVSNPLTLDFAGVLALERQDQTTDFHCVEGWSVYDVPWNGVQLARVLDLAQADAGATHLTFHSVGGQYSESLPISVARETRTILGYGVDGSTLPLAHGFPLRLVVPRLLGYKNAKYLSRIEVTDHPETGFWESYGYSYDGEVPASRLRPDKY
jgi:DMSO/TMAO reductase YedYZ molybdopterin-dependent catalytic subunit